jgi:hypothetical protein
MHFPFSMDVPVSTSGGEGRGFHLGSFPSTIIGYNPFAAHFGRRPCTSGFSLLHPGTFSSMPDHQKDLALLLLTFAWACLQNGGSWINPRFLVVIPTQALLHSLFMSMGFEFCPDLLSVLQAPSPPSIDWFMALNPVVPKGVWGVYAVVLKKKGHPDLLYIGSATQSKQGARGRFSDYRALRRLPKYVKRAIADGYKICSHTLLCWCQIPAASLRPAQRHIAVLLEAVLTCAFWALPRRDKWFGFQGLCPWSRSAFEYKGCCSHNPLLEPVEGDLDLTKEELEELEAATRAKDKAYASSYGREKRASPTEGWKASQKARNAKQYPQTRAKQVKAIEEKTFYCSVCDVASADASAQAIHNGTPRHIRWSTHGRCPWCEPCGKGFRYPSDLAAHEKRPCHIEKVASMS